MLRFVFGAFIVLHGLVHLLYFGQSRKAFELQPGLQWPDGAWAFSRLLGDETTRLVAGAACIVATLGLVLGGVGLLVKNDLWRMVVVGAVSFSSVLYILLWDGQFHHLDAKGLVGILINVAIAVVVLVLRWPE